jgi:oxygen-dependent protoporphyrinogen oxidase
MFAHSTICLLVIRFFFQIIRTRSLLLTTPAYVTASLLGGERGMLPHSARLLAEISYPPVAVVVSAYPNEAFKVGRLYF